jgi:hypothetical protein
MCIDSDKIYLVYNSSLLRIMSPVLQTLITLTIRVLLRLLFLRKMPFTVCYDLPHVIDIVLLILVRILLGILLQDGNYLAAGIMADCFATTVVLGPAGADGFFAAEPILKL